MHGVVGTPGALELLEDGLLVIAGGKVVAIHREAGSARSIVNAKQSILLAPDEMCMPGFIDTHVHAPQYAFTGTATDLPLMDWLQKYTFPAERRMADVALARRVYEALVAKLLAHGTTTAVYYGSIHLEATKLLVDVCRAKGQRAFVGKVAMDQHGAEGYQETTAASLRDTEALIEYCHACEPSAADAVARLVNPVVTPRFIPTCSAELLTGLGALAAKHRERGCWVQSHIAESRDEMAFVESLYPGERDAAIFDAAGLLTDRCIMAHGVHLATNELRLCAARRAGIACCPLSNTFFADGAFPLVQAQEAGVRVGLGTDVAGGYSPSLLVGGVRHAVYASKALQALAAREGAVEVDYRRAFWTATVGGAAALGLEAELGHFAPGTQFDAVIVGCDGGAFDTLDTARCLAADFERYCNLGDDRNVKATFVRGRRVGVAGAHQWPEEAPANW